MKKLILGKALVGATFYVVLGCTGTQQVSQLPTTQQQPTYQPVSQPSVQQQQPPVTAQSAPVRLAGVDELDVAIRDASDYLNDNIPKGSKIVILNVESVSGNLSEYIIDELIANAVNDKNFSVVDRRQLEAIQSEQKFQMSGAVDDKDALAIGKFFGASTIISGAMRDIGGRYRMTIRALAVQTAQVQGQYNRNMAISETLAGLANSSGSRPAIGAVSTPSGGATQGTFTAPTNTTPTIQGTFVPGNSLSEKLAWLQRSADSHNTYIIEVRANENVTPHTFEYKGAINITIVLKGDNVNRTIRLQSHGTMFKIRPNVTFVLDNNITLHGHSGNSHALIDVDGGVFRMNAGSRISNNVNTQTDEIPGGGGGVRVVSSGSFTMNGGTISGNVARGGAGVWIGGGSFTMNDGTISGNTATYGAGVDVNTGSFTMSGGTISGNTATSGGGVGVNMSQTFTMRGGIITGNTATEYAGGINVFRATFIKNGGIITGYNSDPNNGNVVRDEVGNVLARRGHAVSVNDAEQRKETTAGSEMNLSYENGRASGAWDQ